MSSPVIDLSHHNPTPDWNALKAAGVVGIIHKATEGTSYVDPTYGQRAHDAAAAGLIFVPYHFLHPGSISAQMDWFLSHSSPPAGGRVALDYETDATLDELCEAVEYLWEIRPDLQITVYSGHTIKDQLGDSIRGELTNTSLWIAQYTSASAPTLPAKQWPTWSLWQWTDKESVPGLSQPADGNRWNGSAESLVRWLSPAGSVPEPETDDSKTIWINIPDDSRLIVNGVEVKL